MIRTKGKTMSFDLDNAKHFHSFSLSEDGTFSTGISGETPRSSISAGLDSSAFGSGSSVLSQWEPPTEAELANLYPDKAALSQLLEESANCEGNLEELEAVISKLQAIYLYRQGLKALAEERLGAALGGNGGSSTPASGACLSSSFGGEGSGDFRSLLMNSSQKGSPAPVSSYRADPPPTAFPGSTNSIWRMNSAPVSPQLTHTVTPQQSTQPPPAAQYPGVVSTQDLAALARLQYQLYQDTLRRYKKSRNGRGQRYQRRKPRRNNSAPVMLRAPQWADSSWHPMTAVLAKGDGAGTGTGVFIPGAKSDRDCVGQPTQKSMDTGMLLQAPGKMATPADLPEEWLY
ncbi:hypothetical protein BSKO_03751 [Bryopsis sp. KO-2023]|nr:hypothetical protein BSKO_03751 [Bryopsis sp. KO-2023]